MQRRHLIFGKIGELGAPDLAKGFGVDRPPVRLVIVLGEHVRLLERPLQTDAPMDDAFVVDEAAGPNLDGGATRARVADKLAAPTRNDAPRVPTRQRRTAALDPHHKHTLTPPRAGRQTN